MVTPVGSSVLELSVGDGKGARTFEFPLSFSDPWELDLFTDRKLYEPGETVHGWVRLRDRRSHRPLVDTPIQLTLTGTSAQNRTLTTAASGVVSLSAQMPDEAR